MSAQITFPSPQQKPSEAERAALLNLLSDEDPGVYQTVRTRIISCGPEVREWMRPLVLSGDPLLRRRSQEIVRYFARQDADTRFLSFCLKHGEDFDLEESAWMLAQTAYPEINVEAYQAVLDDYAAEMREQLDGENDGNEILTVINKFLFSQLKYAGNEIAYYDPQNSYLNRVIDRRTGNPISLCVFYLLLARRLKLPMAGVGLPGHFICRYQSASEEIYLDPFNRGKMMDKADCIQFLSHLHPEAREEFLLPTTPRRVMARICNNLHQIYKRQGAQEDATRLQRYLVALSR
jgi:regulator of sirC expression with transglutaminase-like and TPR domain